MQKHTEEDLMRDEARARAWNKKPESRYKEEIAAIHEAVRADQKRQIARTRHQKYEFVLRFTDKYKSFYVGQKTCYVPMMVYSYGNLHFTEDPSGPEARKYFATAAEAVEFKHTLMVPVTVEWVYARPVSIQPSKVPDGDQRPKTE
jgi:hypothetical protein